MRYVGILLFAMVIVALGVVMNMAVRQDALVVCKDEVGKQMPGMADLVTLMTGDVSPYVGRMQVCMSAKGFSAGGCEGKDYLEKTSCYHAVMDMPYVESIKSYIGLGK